ncbi:hypothetical protein DTO212C5_1523 [Paecilomyces variotii]|nr:hypothetical protein DTO212C5_1523 [Paecilomyces variotii]
MALLYSHRECLASRSKLPPVLQFGRYILAQSYGCRLPFLDKRGVMAISDECVQVYRSRRLQIHDTYRQGSASRGMLRAEKMVIEDRSHAK